MPLSPNVRTLRASLVLTLQAFLLSRLNLVAYFAPLINSNHPARKFTNKSRVMDLLDLSAVKQIVSRISLTTIDAEQSHSGNLRMLPAGGTLCAAS